MNTMLAKTAKKLLSFWYAPEIWYSATPFVNEMIEIRIPPSCKARARGSLVMSWIPRKKTM